MRAVAIVIACAVLGGCPGGGPPPRPIENASKGSAAPAAPSDAMVVARGGSEWSVSVTRRQAQETATGTVVCLVAPTAANPAPHAMVAEAEAWLALARRAHEAAVDSDAIAAARAGIAVLGTVYRPKGIKDDTSLRLGLVDDQLREGKTSEAADGLVSVLNTRVALYFMRYKAEVKR